MIVKSQQNRIELETRPGGHDGASALRGGTLASAHLNHALEVHVHGVREFEGLETRFSLVRGF